VASRRIAFVPALAAAALLLAGCGPAGGPSASPTPTPAVSPSPTPSSSASAPAPAGLPAPADDVLLRVSGTITAPNGATAAFAVDVHQAVDAHESPAKATLLDRCQGEVDESMLDEQGLSIAPVDVRFAPQSGDWPSSTELLLIPVRLPDDGAGAGYLVAESGLVQFDPAAGTGPGEYTPHCLQPAIVHGLTGGTVYFVGGQDTSGTAGHPPYTEWTRWDFGLMSMVPQPGWVVSGSGVVFTACTTQLSAAGQGMMQPDTVPWQLLDTASACTIGGGDGELGIGD